MSLPLIYLVCQIQLEDFQLSGSKSKLSEILPPPHAFRNRNFTFAMKWQFNTVAACYKTSRQEHFSVFTTVHLMLSKHFVFSNSEKKTFPGGGGGVDRTPVPGPSRALLLSVNF
jgi:hypothetical protein